MLAVLGAPALAQTSTFSNTTTGAINGSTTCAAPLVRNFTVGTSFTVSDVDLGVLATHTWRGDMQITLQSPAGTRVQLVNGDINAVDGDNFNVRLDDAVATLVNTDGSTNHTTTAPPYQNQFRPNALLSAFNGQNSAGTWRLEICDLFPGADDGTFQRADLYLTQVPANYADLSLTSSVNNASPANGATISYTLTVTNAGAPSQAATGITVGNILPLGTSFVSASGSGSFNSGTGIWTVPNLAPGASATITITATVTASAGATITSFAEIRTSSLTDLDSTPNNGSVTEDDDAQATFTVSGTRVAGTPPVLTCPLTTVHDWDAVTWAAGSTSNSYGIANIGTVGWTITNPGTWLNNATYGGLSPAEQTAVNGGIAGAGQSLFQLTDMANQTQSAVTTITLPTAVPGLQFRIFDVDFASGQFADRVTVTGTFNGANVTPVLTNGIANYVIGNSAFGDATSGDTSGNGNVVVTFTSPVDTIVISYGNHSLAPANPGQQAIAIHDITFCRPQATLSIAKSSSVISDPVNGTTNPAMIPGAVVRYCLLVTNPGSATTTAIAVTDTIPANLTYVPGSMASGTSCAGATTAEDDNASGADESDPFGAQLSGTTIIGTAASIGPASTFALRFSATVN
ncbi:proprotein convertase P-domain-containing protein [Sphingomonas lacunae]|uniref:proprotein convertase P-domain-containing protein n=1 Tax=Sphingomonas lacunae TaxID=2698828 RepID=UPI001FE39702|nr:proprotein convertase P-domain-containing protein [Sphingomonas lacunae]